MADKKCPYFYTAADEKYLCSVKEHRWAGKSPKGLDVLSCDSSAFTTCETYKGQQRVMEKARSGLNRSIAQEAPYGK